MATDIRVGMRVRTPHGIKLGRVVGIERGLLVVKKGRIFGHEVDVPLVDVEQVVDGEVVLSAEAADRHQNGGRMGRLADRPKLDLSQARSALPGSGGDPRLTGSGVATGTVTRDAAPSSGGPRITYRHSTVGTSDDGQVRAWTSEGELLSQSLRDVKERRYTSSDEDEREGPEPRPTGFEDSQAEHP